MTENVGDIDGPLYIEIGKTYEEMYAHIQGRKFQAFQRAKQNFPASQANHQETPIIEVIESFYLRAFAE
jgi:hypothetical protein